MISKTNKKYPSIQKLQVNRKQTRQSLFQQKSQLIKQTQYSTKDFDTMKLNLIEKYFSKQPNYQIVQQFVKQSSKQKIASFYCYYFLKGLINVQKQKAQLLLLREIQTIMKKKSIFHKINQLIEGREKQILILHKNLEDYSKTKIQNDQNQQEIQTNNNIKKLIQNIYGQFKSLRVINIDIINQITTWKKFLLELRRQVSNNKQQNQPIIYFYKQQNYLVKMINDNNFVFNYAFDNISFPKQNDPFIIKPLQMPENINNKKLQIDQDLKQKIFQSLNILAREKGQSLREKLQIDKKYNKNYKLNQYASIKSQKNNKQSVQTNYESNLMNIDLLKQNYEQFDNLIKKYQKATLMKIKSNTNNIQIKNNKRASSTLSNKNDKNTQIIPPHTYRNRITQLKQQLKNKNIQENKTTDILYQQKRKSMINQQNINKFLPQISAQKQLDQKKVDRQQRNQKLKNILIKNKSMTVREQNAKLITLAALNVQKNINKKNEITNQEEIKEDFQIEQNQLENNNNSKKKNLELKQLKINSIKQTDIKGKINYQPINKNIRSNSDVNIINRINPNSNIFSKPFEIGKKQIQGLNTKKINQIQNQQRNQFLQSNNSIEKNQIDYPLQLKQKKKNYQSTKTIPITIIQKKNTFPIKQQIELPIIKSDSIHIETSLNNLKQKIKEISHKSYSKITPLNNKDFSREYTNSKILSKDNTVIQQELANVNLKTTEKYQNKNIQIKKKLLNYPSLNNQIENLKKVGKKNNISDIKEKSIVSNQEIKKIQDKKQEKQKLISYKSNQYQISENLSKSFQIQKKKLENQKAQLENRLNLQNERIIKKLQEQSKIKQVRLKQMYQAQIQNLKNQQKKQVMLINFQLQKQQIKRKQKQQQLRQEIEKKSKLEQQINKKLLKEEIINQLQKQQKKKMEDIEIQRMKEQEQMKIRIQEQLLEIKKTAEKQLKELQQQNRQKALQLAKKNEQQQQINNAIQEQRKKLEEQRKERETKLLNQFIQLKNFYQQIEQNKKQKIDEYSETIFSQKPYLSQETKLQLKFEILQELQMRQEKQKLEEKIYEIEKQKKLQQLKQQYRKLIIQQRNKGKIFDEHLLNFSQDTSRIIYSVQPSILNTESPMSVNLIKKINSNVIISEGSLKIRIQERIQQQNAQFETSKKIGENKFLTQYNFNQNQIKQSHTADNNQSRNNKKQFSKNLTNQIKQIQQYQKKTNDNLKLVHNNEKQSKQKQQNNNEIKIQMSQIPNKQAFKSIVQNQQQLIKKWNNLKVHFKSCKKIYITSNNIQIFLNDFFSKHPPEFKNIMPYTEKQFFKFFRKKQIDIFEQSFGWKEGDYYLLFGNINCLQQISKVYGNIQVQIRMKLNAKNQNQKRYIAKQLKFYQQIGYVYQKKINDQIYAIKFIIKIPKSVVINTYKRSNKLAIHTFIQMSYSKKNTNSINQNSYIFPLAKKLLTFLTQEQKRYLDLYGKQDFTSRQLFRMIAYFDLHKLDTKWLNFQDKKNSLKMNLYIDIPVCLFQTPCYRLNSIKYSNNSNIYYISQLLEFTIMVIPLEKIELEFNIDNYIKLFPKGGNKKETILLIPIWRSEKTISLNNYGTKAFTYSNNVVPQFYMGSVIQEPHNQYTYLNCPFIFCIFSNQIQKSQQMIPIFAEIVKDSYLIKERDISFNN